MLEFEREEGLLLHHGRARLRGNRGGARFEAEWRRVVPGHEQAFHQFSLDHVSFHNFRDVGFIADPIPDALRINDDAGTIFAMIQAPGLVGTDDAFEAKALNFLLEECVKLRGTVIGTAPSRVTLGPLINANEDMMLESAHDCVFS